jgi:hypothetical protein
MASNKRTAAEPAAEPAAKKIKNDPSSLPKKKTVLFVQQNLDGPLSAGENGKLFSFAIPLAGFSAEHAAEFLKLVEQYHCGAFTPMNARKVMSKKLAALFYEWVQGDFFPDDKVAATPESADLYLLLDTWECDYDETFHETEECELACDRMTRAILAMAPTAEKRKDGETYLILFEQQGTTAENGKHFAIKVPAAGFTPEHASEIRKLLCKNEVAVELRKVMSKKLASMFYTWICEDKFETETVTPKPAEADAFLLMGEWEDDFDEAFCGSEVYCELDSLMGAALSKKPVSVSKKEEEAVIDLTSDDN